MAVKERIKKLNWFAFTICQIGYWAGVFVRHVLLKK
jgi:hypothetical protein